MLAFMFNRGSNGRDAVLGYLARGVGSHAAAPIEAPAHIVAGRTRHDDVRAPLHMVPSVERSRYSVALPADGLFVSG